LQDLTNAAGTGAIAKRISDTEPRFFRDRVIEALPKLDEIAQAGIRAGEVPGVAIAVVLQDEVVYAKGFGVRKAGENAAVGPDTVFQLASLSKPIASTVVAALVSDGAVTWDTRIADADPGFRLHDAYPSAEVTISDLFSHRSGLHTNAGYDLDELGFSRDEILRRIGNLEPSSSFRSHSTYSNLGLTEGAVAAARAAGLSWEDAADTKLFKPLGMASTSARYADFLRQSDRAALHIRRDGRPRDGRNGPWQALITRSGDAVSPAGGVSTSVHDLTRWMRLQLGNGVFEGRELIKAIDLEPTHTPLIWFMKNFVTHSDVFYGLGWMIENTPHGTIWWHNGAFEQGARTLLKLIPARQIGIAVLTSAFPTGFPEGIVDSFFDIVFDGAPSRDWTAEWYPHFAEMIDSADENIAQYGTPPGDASPAMPPAAYAGTYANDYLGQVRVVPDGTDLMLAWGAGGKITHRLTHFDRDTFTMPASVHWPDVPFPLVFSNFEQIPSRPNIVENRKATTLTIEWKNPTTLRRVSD
jgi:CubicO group peptidase (beta-lactamase class C family)